MEVSDKGGTHLGLGLDALLNNFLFILIPIFLYQIFWVDKNKNDSKLSKVVQILGMALIILLCMSFPVKFGTDFLFDLRHIPFILGALYLGYPAALTAFFTIVSYRYFLGGEGVYVNFWVITSIAFLVPLLRRFYFNLKRKSRIFFSAGLSLMSGYSLVALIIIAGGIPIGSFYELAISYILVQVLGMLFVTYLIEEMSQNKKLQDQMIHKEKLNTINDLSESITKEIQHPLTATKRYLQLLYHENVSPENRRRYLDMALKELDRGELVITDFLSFTQSKGEEQVYINVVNELEYVVKIITPYSITNNVRIHVDTTVMGDSVMVMGNHNQFQQSLVNLLKNSIEAMPNGGDLTITASSERKKVTIEVTDTGIGMSSEEVAKLGTPFYTTKEIGTGLGTSLVFNTINAMKGTFDIQSEKGKGTTVSIQLPSFHDKVVVEKDYAS